MSGSGHSRRSDRVPMTSGLPPIFLGWLRWRPTVSFGVADLDRPAVTLSTQLQRYAMHRTSVGGGRAASAASRRRF